jgi:hypothetical protein
MSRSSESLDVVGRDDVVGQLAVEVVEREELFVAAEFEQALHHVFLVFLFHAHLSNSPRVRSKEWPRPARARSVGSG